MKRTHVDGCWCCLGWMMWVEKLRWGNEQLGGGVRWIDKRIQEQKHGWLVDCEKESGLPQCTQRPCWVERERCACFLAKPSSIVSWSDVRWPSDFAVVADEMYLCLLYHTDSHCNAIAIYFKQHEKNLGGLLLFILTPPPYPNTLFSVITPWRSYEFIGLICRCPGRYRSLSPRIAWKGRNLKGNFNEPLWRQILTWGLKLPPMCLMLIATGMFCFEIGAIEVEMKGLGIRSMGAIWEPVAWVTGLISLVLLWSLSISSTVLH